MSKLTIDEFVKRARSSGCDDIVCDECPARNKGCGEFYVGEICEVEEWAKTKGWCEESKEDKRYENAMKAIDDTPDGVICKDGKTHVKKIIAAALGVEVEDVYFSSSDDNVVVSTCGGRGDYKIYGDVIQPSVCRIVDGYLVLVKHSDWNCKLHTDKQGRIIVKDGTIKGA